MPELTKPTNGRPATSIPCVVDGDIEESEHVLGVSFDESRRSILLSNESFDVQACPGSGKTTLLVAKLFILVKKWPHTRRGICVISHTNVARQEIERKLASTGIGQRMLNYPHFVGTIHSFVNEYLALPLLRSEGYHVQIIDDDTCFDWIKRRLLSSRGRRLGNLSYKERTLERAIRSLVGAPTVAPDPAVKGINQAQWKILADAKRGAIKSGIWYHFDMFAWAERLLTKYPRIIDWVRWRFPVVLLDEAQDTSELQASLLSMVFPAETCKLCQRFGDSNQAIYDTGQSEASTDKFPADGFRSITDSKRFGPEIARLAHPIAPEPASPEVCGNGPRTLDGAPDPASISHTIFLFSTETIHRVLPAFGKLLLETFPDEVLRGDGFLARVIGRVCVSPQGENKIPRHLGDYWGGYEAHVAKFEPRLDELVVYVRLAQHVRKSAGECNESFRLIMRGISELIRVARPEAIPRRVRTSRWIVEELKNAAEAIKSLRRLLWDWLVEARPLVEGDWPNAVATLRSALTPILSGEWNETAGEFCRWSTKQPATSLLTETTGSTAPNVYRFEHNGRFVDIEVGTIHSAKGQTHTATLVVETFAWKHDLEDLLPWLSGQREGSGQGCGQRRGERMRLVFTAMTRPSHLLCLALRGSAVSEETKHDLIHCGWEVVDLETNGAHGERRCYS